MGKCFAGGHDPEVNHSSWLLLRESVSREIGVFFFCIDLQEPVFLLELGLSPGRHILPSHDAMAKEMT